MMSIICSKISEIPAFKEKGETMKRREHNLSYFRVILAIIKRDVMFFAWTQSRCLNDDLEKLFFIQQPTNEEIQ